MQPCTHLSHLEPLLPFDFFHCICSFSTDVQSFIQLLQRLIGTTLLDCRHHRMCFGKQESCAPFSVLEAKECKQIEAGYNKHHIMYIIGMNIIAQMQYKVATRLPTSIQPPFQPSLGFVVERSERQRWPKLPRRYLAVPSDQRAPRFRWMRRRQISRNSSRGAELPHLEGVLGILSSGYSATS